MIIIVDTMANARKYLSERSALPKARHVVVYLEEIPAEEKLKSGGYLISWNELLALGASIDDATLDAREATTLPQHCSSLIYTSGTTGNPKGVMVSHDSLLFGARVARKSMRFNIDAHHVISYLPLSHIAAQMLDVYIPAMFTSLDLPTTVHFARPDVLKGTLLQTIQAVRPTYFFGVPRVWEKFVDGIRQKSRANPPSGLKLKLLTWARSVGVSNSRARQAHGDGVLRRGTSLAERLIFKKVKASLGFDRCHGFFTGAAPISMDTQEFMSSIGIDICEVYGMSETCGLGTSSTPYRFQFGSCGSITPYTELQVEHVEGRDKPGEGEICFRGRNVMMGYYHNETKTRECIDNDGWLHSGDVGRIDGKGQVYITGRIKELIITAGGENIAPAPIEDTLKRLLPGISNAMVVGDRRKYNVVVMTPRLEPDFETGGFTNRLVGESLLVDPDAKTAEDAAKSTKWRQYVEKGMKAYNEGPTCVSHAQRLQKVVVLPFDFSIPGGHLTATMKLKRAVVVEALNSTIEHLYAE